MMSTTNMIICIVIMAGVTYLVRMLPFTLFRKKIKNTFVNSFLYYVPFAVLSAMTIPEILYSSPSMVAAAAGFVCALVLSYFERSLMTCAAVSCAVVFVAGLLV